jgi:hypothetical protein
MSPAAVACIISAIAFVVAILALCVAGQEYASPQLITLNLMRTRVRVFFIHIIP